MSLAFRAGLRWYRALLATASCGMVCLSLPLAAAPPVPPPSSVLQHPRNQVMVGSYLSKLPDGRYVFERIEDLRGPDASPDQVVLRAPGWLVEYLSPNEPYLLSYSNYVSNPRFGKDYNIDTEGPRLINTTGLEPALFRDSPGLRVELLTPMDAARRSSAAFTEQAIAGLTGPDTQLQNYYAAELTQHAGLMEHVEGPVAEAIRSLLGNKDGHPSARAQLLRLAAQDVDVYTPEFLQGVVLNVLREAPLEGYQDLQPRSGELVRFALELVAEKSMAIDLPVIERLVRCDSAALSESALLAIRHLDPSAERAVAEQALRQTFLPATTREFLLDHLRRLDLAASSTPVVSQLISQE